MTRDEIAKGIANRFVHSRTYILLYLVMAALSITTVVLNMVTGCPGVPFYVLEFIINTAMILEVSIRFVAFGRVSWLPKYVRALLAQFLFPIAILEILVERCRPDTYNILRCHVAGHLFCGVWKYE